MTSRKQTDWSYDRYSSPQRSSSPYECPAPGNSNAHTSQRDQHNIIMPHVPSLPPMNTDHPSRQNRDTGQRENSGRPSSAVELSIHQNRLSPPPPHAGMSDMTRHSQPLHHNQTTSTHPMHSGSSSSQYYRPDQRHSLPPNTSNNIDYLPRHNSFQTESQRNPISFPSQVMQQQRMPIDYQYAPQMYSHQQYHRHHNPQQPSDKNCTMQYQTDYPHPKNHPTKDLLLNYERQPMTQRQHNEVRNQSRKNSRQNSPLHEESGTFGDAFPENQYQSTFVAGHQNKYQQANSSHPSQQNISKVNENELKILQHRNPPPNDQIQPTQKRKRKPKKFTDYESKIPPKKKTARKRPTTGAEDKGKPKTGKRGRKKKTTTIPNEASSHNLDNFGSQSMSTIGMNPAAAFQRPNSAPVQMGTVDAENIGRHGSNMFSGYINIAENLSNIWQKLGVIFLLAKPDSNAHLDGQNNRNANRDRLIRILNDMGFNYPNDGDIHMAEIKRMSKVLVKIGLYKGSSNNVVNLPMLVSAECEEILKILDKARSSLHQLLSQRNINLDSTISDLLDELNGIRTQIQNIGSLNKELQLQLGKHFHTQKFVGNALKDGNSKPNFPQEVNIEGSKQISYTPHVDMNLFGNMPALSPLKRPTAVPSTNSAMTSSSILNSLGVYPDDVPRHNDMNYFQQLLPVPVDSLQKIVKEDPLQNDIDKLRTTSKKKKTTTKRDTKVKRPAKKKKAQKLGSSATKIKENDSDIILPRQSEVRGKSGKKSIKRLATKLNGKIVLPTGNMVSSKETEALKTLPLTEMETADIPREKIPPKKQEIFIDDRLPTRITNPLLQMPQYPHLSKSMAGNTPIELIPNGAELWNLIQVYFPDPDTHPISFLAKILGFDVNVDARNGELFKFEVETLQLRGRKDDVFFEIPPLGNFITSMNCKKQRLRSESEHKCNSFDKEKLDLKNVDDHLDFVDPMWTSINRCNRGFNDDRFKAANGLGRDKVLSKSCIDLASTMNIITGGLSFRFANLEDDELLFRLNQVRPSFLKQMFGYNSLSNYVAFFWQERDVYTSMYDFTQALKCPSQFFIIADDISKGPVGFIHYKFCWFKLEEKSNISENSEDLYRSGPSVGNIRQDSVSELVLCIEGIHYENTPTTNNPTTLTMKEDSSIKETKSKGYGINGEQSQTNIEAAATCHTENNSIRITETNGEKVHDESFCSTSIETNSASQTSLDGESNIHKIMENSRKQTVSESAVSSFLSSSLDNSVTNTPQTDVQTSKLNVCSGSQISIEMDPERNSLKTHSFKEVATKSSNKAPEHNSITDDGEGLHLNQSSSVTISKRQLVPSAIIKNIDETNHVVLLLIALAVEHARDCDIWYGIHTVSLNYVKFLSTYFRMDQVSVSNKRAHMACDLKKCSFRYALLLFKELNAQNPPHDLGMEKKAIKERMLVKISDSNLIATPKNTNVVNSVEKDERIIESHFKNTSWNKRQRNILVQKNLQEEKDSSIQADTELVTSTNLSWDVLKLFPIKSTKAKTAMTETNDSVLIELKKKQDELLRLESSFIPELRSLLQKVIEERKIFDNESSRRKDEVEKKAKLDYDAVIERRKEADLAWQMQLEQDMDAVCDICNDGEVTVDNQIIFCESCNVAVHQKCYGISKVPSGDYFCHACRFFKRDEQISRSRMFSDGKTKMAPSPLPISCELCPRRQGAFLRCQVKCLNKREAEIKSKWVHVVCAKWQGLQFVDKKKEIIEDVTTLKRSFRQNEYKCSLCQGMRGTFNFCSEEGCNKAMHVTCARLSGVCLVSHGENHDGLLADDSAWTLKCPEHSKIESCNIPDGSLTLEQLEAAAKDFPPEPMPEPPPKPFDKQSARERKKFLDDPENEFDFVQEIRKRSQAAKCEVCSANPAIDYHINQCSSCNVTVHPGCYVGEWNNAENLCEYCSFMKLNDSTEVIDSEYSHCHMCNQLGGVIVKSYAKPINRKRWKDNMKGYSNSLFGKRIWCHAICGM